MHTEGNARKPVAMTEALRTRAFRLSWRHQSSNTQDATRVKQERSVSPELAPAGQPHVQLGRRELGDAALGFLQGHLRKSHFQRPESPDHPAQIISATGNSCSPSCEQRGCGAFSVSSALHRPSIAPRPRVAAPPTDCARAQRAARARQTASRRSPREASPTKPGSVRVEVLE